MGLYREKDSRFWWVAFTVNGKKVRRSTGEESRREAARKAREIRATLERQTPRRRQGSGVLADLAGWDVERTAAEGATQHHQDVLEERWGGLCAWFGAATDPGKITGEQIQAYAAQRRADGAQDVLRRELGDLRRALIEAHRRGWINAVPPFPKTRSTAGTKRKGRFHEPKIIARWIDALPEPAKGQATVAYLTGLRAHEVRRVEASWVRGTELHMPAVATKGKREAVVHLPEEALSAIKDRALTVPIGPLWPSDHKKAFSGARKAIRYTTPISLRDLRHTYGTLSNRLVGIDAARDGLRHTSLALTQRYVTGDTSRVASVGDTLSLTLGSESGQRKVDRDEILARMERATRFELATLSLEGWEQDAIDHLRACNKCRLLVLNCGKLWSVSGEVDRECGQSGGGAA